MNSEYDEFAAKLSDFLHPFAKFSIEKKEELREEGTLTLPIPKEKDFFLKAKLDIRAFETLQKQIEQFLPRSQDNSHSPKDWKTLLEESSIGFLKKRNKTLASASRKDKKDLAAFLESKGYLDYQQASSTFINFHLH